MCCVSIRIILFIFSAYNLFNRVAIELKRERDRDRETEGDRDREADRERERTQNILL